MKVKLKGFTTIELMIAITIIGLLMMTVIVPYLFYQDKAKVRVTKKEIAQILYDGRNMAINGFSSGTTNQSVGLLFDAVNGKNMVTYLGFPFTATGSDINPNSPQTYIIKKRPLEPGMQIDFINGKKKALFFFDAVYGDGKYYTWTEGGTREILTGSEIPIIFSLKGAKAGSLQGTVIYYPETNIVDY